MEAQALPFPAEARRPGLGRQRVRCTGDRLPAVCDQAGVLRLPPDRDHLADDAGDRRARRHRRLVDGADRVPEGGRLGPAVGGTGPRLGVDDACRPLHPADRRGALPAASRDRSPPAVAGQGPLHEWLPAHAPRRRPLRRVPRGRRLPAGGEWRFRGGRRRWQARALGDRFAVRPVGIAGPAGQGQFPGAAPGGLWPPAPCFTVPCPQLHRGLAVRLPLHLAGRRVVEVQPPLCVRRDRDDEQHALEPLALGEEEDVRALSGRPASLARGLSGFHAWVPLGSSGGRWC